MRGIYSLLTVALLQTLFVAPATRANDVPMLLNYQGRLADPTGNPKDGTFSMQFAVYDAETLGNQLPSASPWNETQNVTVTNGVFNVLLGNVTALPTDLFAGGPSDASGPLRYLQVTVGGEVLAPRRRIASAAYAIAPEGIPGPSGPQGPTGVPGYFRVLDGNGTNLGVFLGAHDLASRVGILAPTLGREFCLEEKANSGNDRIEFCTAMDQNAVKFELANCTGQAYMTLHAGLGLYPIASVGGDEARLFSWDSVIVPPSTTYSSQLAPGLSCTNVAPTPLASDEYSQATEVTLPFALPIIPPLSIVPAP